MKPNNNDHHQGDSCPSEEVITSWVMDPASVANEAALQSHVEACGACQDSAAEVRAFSSSLNAVPPESVADDFLDKVLAGIPEDAWAQSPAEKGAPAAPLRWSPRVLFPFAAAAALLVMSVLAAKLFGDKRESEMIVDASPSTIVDGIEWVLEQQQPHGGWDVDALGGRDSYSPALNGLALLALTRSGLEPSKVEQPVRYAALHVSGLQHESGRFGDKSEGMMYNHGIASLALLESYTLTRDERLLEPINKALAFIVSQQSPQGGWGYGKTDQARPNTSITAWQVQSLLLAKKLGIHNDHQPLRKGLAWLSSTVNGSGHFGYEHTGGNDELKHTVTMMGAHCLLTAKGQNIPLDQFVMRRVKDGIATLSSSMPGDYYASYFYASALSSADPEAYSAFLVETKSTLETRQLSQGIAKGAWDYDDRWGGAGGQIYSTSMALLSLLEEGADEAAESELSL